MPERFALDQRRLRENLAAITDKLAEAAQRAGRDPRSVRLLAAVKYLDTEQLGMLADAGLHLLGENRAQALLEKAARWGDAFEWDFIGRLQSRRVREIAPLVRLIHSVESHSAMRALARTPLRVGAGILIEVNVAGEPGKGGVAPSAIDELIAEAPVPVRGLMTMPPHSADPERSRVHFARLRELAAERRLPELSMGTSQDFAVAVEEGATIVRLGSALYL